MDSHFYREVRNDHLFPFVGEKFKYEVNLHQDNETTHKQNLCRCFKKLKHKLGNLNFLLLSIAYLHKITLR